MLFAGFNVSSGEYSLGAAWPRARWGTWSGSWIAYWVGYAGRVDILEKHGSKLHIKTSHLAGPTAGSSATATRRCSSPGCCRSSGRSSRSPRAWRGCLLALQPVHGGRLPALGAAAHVHRQAGRRQLGQLEGQAPLRGLRGDRRHRRRDRISDLPARAGAGAPARRPPRRPEPPARPCARRWPSGAPGARPSWCRFRAPATSRWSRGCSAGPTAARRRTRARRLRGRAARRVGAGGGAVALRGCAAALAAPRP